jgi:hypothetical protein
MVRLTVRDLLEMKIRDNFEKRLDIVLDDIKTSEKGGSNDVFRNLEMEIIALEPEVVEAIFGHVCGDIYSDTLEFWEKATSWINNCFYDDSFPAIARDKYNNPVLVWGIDDIYKFAEPSEIRELIRLYREKHEAYDSKEHIHFGTPGRLRILKANRALEEFGRRYPRCERVCSEYIRMAKSKRKALSFARKKKKEKGK